MQDEWMIRDIDYVSELRSLLLGTIGDDETSLHAVELLTDHKLDFRTVFVPPQKSDQHRKDVQSGTLVLDQSKCSVNKDFIDKTLQLADFLEIDELLAAEYLHLGAQNACRYDRDVFNTAIYLFCTCREIYLDAFRLVVLHIGDNLGDTQLYEEALKVFDQIADRKAFAQVCLEQLNWIEAKAASLQSSEKREKLLGSALLLDDRVFVDKSLSEQHECVAAIFATVLLLRPHENKPVHDCIDYLQRVERWDNYTSHRVLSVMCAIQNLSIATQNPIDRTREAFTTQMQITSLRNIFQVLRPSTNWKCRPLLPVLQIVLSAELSALCRNLSDLADHFDYEQEILLLARSALQANVFQHLITFMLFSKRDVSGRHPFSMFFAADALAQYHVTPADQGDGQTSVSLAACLRHLIVSLIVNLPDLLKEMHINSEDQMLSQEVVEGSTETIDHAEDLFYGMVYTAYESRADLATAFWEDKHGNLHGFIVWASHAEVPSTVYAYFKMMSALAASPESSAEALAFFDPDDLSRTDEQRVLPSENSSFSFIFDSFRYYIGQLDRRTPGGFHEGAELDPHNALILESYMTLISSVLAHSTEPTVLSRLNTKFEALTVLFQLLSQRLPAELYTAIFSLISIFSRDTTLQKTIWQMLEAWLSAMNLDVQTALLTSTSRQRQIEHRPLNSLTTFALVSPTCLAGLIDCLTALLTIHNGQSCVLTFPTSLGDNSRYSGISDYVDFVWHCFISAQSTEHDMDIVRRIQTTESCLRFFVTCLATLELGTVSLSRTGLNLDTLSHTQLKLRDYISMHAGTKILQVLRSQKHRDAIFGVIRSHDTADPVIHRMLIPAVTLTLRFCSLVLDKADLFDEFVAPMTANPTGIINRGNLSRDISQDPGMLVHISLLCSESDEDCADSAISFLCSCDRRDLLNEQHFAILCSADQSKTILLGIIHLFDDRNVEGTARKMKLLKFIQSDLRKYKKKYALFSISHFILGFTAANIDGVLSVGYDSGHIGSGRSLLHSILAILSETNRGDESLSNISLELFDVATSIIQLVCESKKSTALAMPVIREHDFLTSQLDKQLQIQLENAECDETDALIELPMLASLSNTRRRSSFMRYCAQEILVCKNESITDVLSTYTRALFPLVGTTSSYGVILFDWLDVLDINVSFADAQRTWQYFKPDSYLSLLESISNESLHQLRLALSLNFGSVSAKADSAALKSQIETEYRALINYLSHIIYRTLLRSAIYECIVEWSTVTAVIFGSLLQPQQAERRFSGDLLQTLLVRLPGIQESAHNLASVLCESISTLIQCTEHLEIGPFYQFFRATLACLQSPASTPMQREHLYLTGICCLQSIQRLRNDEKPDTQLSNMCKSGVDRLLIVVCQDAGVQDELMRITACSFLDLLLKLCEDPATLLLTHRIVRLNLLTRFAYQFEVSLQGQEHPEALSRQFDLILRFAMTRIGAQDLIRNRSLFQALGEKFLRLEDGTEDVSNAIRLLSIYIAAVVAMGLQTSVSQNLLQNFASTWAEKLSDHARRMQKAANPKFEEFQSLLQLLSSLKAPSSSSVH